MRKVSLLLFVTILAVSFAAVSVSYAGTTVAVSIDSSGKQGTGGSEMPSISADGRYIAFESTAEDLVSGDKNGTTDVFVHDRQTGKTEIISVNSKGTLGDGLSSYPSISADGRFVAFRSQATNLVPGDTNGTTDVFVHDRQTGRTEIISVDSKGKQGNASSDFPSISADGRFVAFLSQADNLVPGDPDGYMDVFVHDRQTGTTEIVSKDSMGTRANGWSSYPSISADGRFVAFRSQATNLVPDDTNGATDIFVHNRQTGKTEIISVDSNGKQGNGNSDYPAISADGRFVAFHSVANNLVPNDTNGVADVFVRDRQAGTTESASKDSDGKQGNKRSEYARISADGRYVAFESDANTLSPDDTNGKADVFVYDRQTGQTEVVSINNDGILGNDDGSCLVPVLSGDGRYIAFMSEANNLMPDDANGRSDIFVRDRQ